MKTACTVLSTLVCGAAAATSSTHCAAGASPIPDDGSLAVIPITVPATGEVQSLTLSIVLDHDWIGDVRLSLRSPLGTEVLLIDRPGFSPGLALGAFPGPFGCGGRDLNATFSDDAAVLAQDQCSTTAQPVIAGSVRPLGLLGAFAGEPASGEWQLVVQDLSPIDTGSLGSACLTVVTVEDCPADVNGDGAATPADFTAWLSCFNDPASAPFCGNADVNDDAGLDPADFTAWLAAFQLGCS